MASMIPPCELSEMQAIAEASLDTSITITPTVSRTPTAGGYTETPGTPVATMARFARPTAPVLAQYADRISGLQAWVMSYSTRISVHPGDTITITAGSAAGTTFTVHAPMEVKSFNTLNAALVCKPL